MWVARMKCGASESDRHTSHVLLDGNVFVQGLVFPILTETFAGVSGSVLSGGCEGLDRFVVPHKRRLIRKVSMKGVIDKMCVLDLLNVKFC